MPRRGQVARAGLQGQCNGINEEREEQQRGWAPRRLTRSFWSLRRTSGEGGIGRLDRNEEERMPGGEMAF